MPKQIIQISVGWNSLHFVAENSVITELLKLLNSGQLFSKSRMSLFGSINVNDVSIVVSPATIEEDLIGLVRLFPEWDDNDKSNAADSLMEDYRASQIEKNSLERFINANETPS